MSVFPYGGGNSRFKIARNGRLAPGNRKHLPNLQQKLKTLDFIAFLFIFTQHTNPQQLMDFSTGALGLQIFCLLTGIGIVLFIFRSIKFRK